MTKFATVFSGQCVDKPEACVVQGLLVLIVGITETGNNTQVRHWAVILNKKTARRRPFVIATQRC
jgi:hypothetical protein